MPVPNYNRPIYYDEGGTNQSSEQRTYTDNHNNTYQAGKYDYISSLATPQQVQQVYQKYGIHPPTNDPPNNPVYYRSGGGGGGYSTPAYEQPDYSAWFNALTDINNQKYEALKKEMARQKQKADDSANANYSRNLREWQKMYADKRNGQGLSNRLNIGYNRDSALASNREAFDTNNLSAISGRYSDLANLTSYLPNMDSGTIKKIMANVSGWK